MPDNDEKPYSPVRPTAQDSQLAADKLEALSYENDAIKGAASGVAPDGTPIDDLLTEIRELKSDLATATRTIRFIKHTATLARSVDAYKSIITIRDAVKKWGDR